MDTNCSGSRVPSVSWSARKQPSVAKYYVPLGSDEKGALIAEGSGEDLGVRGGPGINSSLPTSGKCFSVLATAISTLVHIIWMSILILTLISLTVKPRFPDQKTAGSKEMEECIGNPYYREKYVCNKPVSFHDWAWVQDSRAETGQQCEQQSLTAKLSLVNTVAVSGKNL